MLLLAALAMAIAGSGAAADAVDAVDGDGDVDGDVPLEPLPPTPPVPELFALAHDAFAHKDGEGCGKLAQQAVTSGQLDEAQLLTAWMIRGACFHLAGDDDKARRSYAVAVRVRPGVGLEFAEPAPGSHDNAAFRGAKNDATPLAFHGARVPDPPDTVAVELTGDDLQLVKAAILVRDGEEMARLPLDAQAPRHRVSGLGDGPLTLFLLDKHGNKLVHEDIAALAEHVIVKNGPAENAAGAAPTILTTLGATAIGAGLVGVVVSGIGVASLEDKALDEGQLWLVGVGASTGLFLVGASLVVVDQGLN